MAPIRVGALLRQALQTYKTKMTIAALSNLLFEPGFVDLSSSPSYRLPENIGCMLVFDWCIQSFIWFFNKHCLLCSLLCFSQTLVVLLLSAGESELCWLVRPFCKSDQRGSFASQSRARISVAEVDTLRSISKSLKIGGTERPIRNYRLVVCYFLMLCGFLFLSNMQTFL